MNIKRFNEAYLRGGEPTAKYYWLISKSGRDVPYITVGCKKDDDNYPWTIIGTDEEFSNEEIENNYTIDSNEIIYPYRQD